MKTRSKAFCSVSIILTVAALAAIGAHYNLKQREILGQREADVKALTRVYLKGSREVKTIEDLLQKLQNAGVKLHNPIPEDPARPCYRLAYTNGGDNQMVLIEETNVTDKNYIVRSMFDGSVVFQKREP